MDVAEKTKEATLTAMDDLVSRMASMEFESVFLYVLLTLAAVIICFEGYKIYKIGLMAIGFAVGYSRSHALILNFSLTDEQMLMAQVIAGIACALLAGVVVHAGIFIAAYSFAQANLSAVLVALLAQHVEIPKLAEPLFTRLAGVVVAGIVAWLAVKSERVVVVILTAVVGGFAAVNFFCAMVPVFPVDISFFLQAPAIFMVIAKIALSLAGVGVQGTSKKKE